MGNANGLNGSGGGTHERTVIITDALLRKSLAAVRALGSNGVTVYAAESTKWTPAGFSKHCAGSLLSPSPSAEPERYAEWIAKTLERMPGAMLMPMDDASVRAALQAADRLPPSALCLLPEPESFEQASDKHATVLAAGRAKVECPLTWLPLDEDELRQAVSEAGGYPLVVKPRRSSGSRGIRIASSWQALLEAYREACKSEVAPMIQQYIPPGERIDAALLIGADGETVASFAQREVRHFPADIGPSTVQESIWMPELIEQAERLLRELNWRGIAEVEWMRDPRDGRLKLMEINPRYWNSLHLAIQSGINFPHMHYRLSLGEKVSPLYTYAVGQMTRNLLPGDLLHAFSTRKLRKLQPPLLGKGGRPLEDDILSWHDPMASVGFAAACARYALDKRMWASLFKR
jgi:predicted ATP-grasp superfamily ATP-dependent carboligase